MVWLAHILQGLVDNTRARKVVVGKEIELVQEIPRINAAQRIHLRERQDTREAGIELAGFHSRGARVRFNITSAPRVVSLGYTS